MNPAKLQDDHTEEVRVFVDMAKRYITPLEVKVILELGSRDACEAVSLKRAFRNATVYAFECNPPAIELCRQNIGDKKDIVLVPMAVSDVDGVVDFYAIDPRNTVTTHADGNIGASSLSTFHNQPLLKLQIPFKRCLKAFCGFIRMVLKWTLLGNAVFETATS